MLSFGEGPFFHVTLRERIQIESSKRPLLSCCAIICTRRGLNCKSADVGSQWYYCMPLPCACEKVGRSLTAGARAAFTAERIWEMGPSAAERLCTLGATASWAVLMPSATVLPASVTVWSTEGVGAKVGSASNTGCMFSDAKLRPLICGSAGRPSTLGSAGKFRSSAVLFGHALSAQGHYLLPWCCIIASVS